MSLQQSIAKISFLLEVPDEKRDMKWAHDMCTASRFIHLDVWKFCSEHKCVEDTVIPLLGDKIPKAVNAMLKKNFSEKEKKEISVYLKNVELRKNNLEMNYLKGKPSAFVPDSMISEWEAVVS